MINKIQTGIDFLDKDLGGIYQHRSYVFCGEKLDGKNALTSRFLVEGLKKEEMCLLVTSGNIRNYLVESHDLLNFDFSVYMQSGFFNVLEYMDPDSAKAVDLEQYILEVKDFVEKKGVERVVIDSLPVLEDPELKATEINVKRFIGFLEEENITTLISLGKPKTLGASRLEGVLIREAAGAFNVTEKISEETGREYFSFDIEKLVGLQPPFPSWDYQVVKGKGAQLIIKREKLNYSHLEENNLKFNK